MSVLKYYQVVERKSSESGLANLEQPLMTPEILEQAKREAEEILEKARRDAELEKDEKMRQAQVEAEEIRVQAQKEGFEKGQNEGYQSLAQMIKDSQSILQQAEGQRNRIVDSAKKEILALATHTAQRIVHQELTTDPDLMMNIVTDAVAKISDRDQVILRVRREDLDYFKNHRDQLEDLLDGVKNLAIQPDKHVGMGGLIIETKLGMVDARIETKMEVLQKAMLAVYEQDALKLQLSKQDEQGLAEAEMAVAETDSLLPDSLNSDTVPVAPDSTGFDLNTDELNLDNLDLNLE